MSDKNKEIGMTKNRLIQSGAWKRCPTGARLCQTTAGVNVWLTRVELYEADGRSYLKFKPGAVQKDFENKAGLKSAEAFRRAPMDAIITAEVDGREYTPSSVTLSKDCYGGHWLHFSMF